MLRAFEELDREGIEVDILVNNAGVQFRKPIVELALNDWDRVLRGNLTSAFLVGREVARRMIARGRGGKVINIGSVTCEAARATISPYVTSKGGIRMLTRAMAAEWASHNIQVNAIGPGYMATEMNMALIENPAGVGGDRDIVTKTREFSGLTFCGPACAPTESRTFARC